MKFFSLTSIVAAITSFSTLSCTNTDCISDELRFSLIGFTDIEADSILVRKFIKGGNFNMPVDTAYLDMGFQRSNDTLKVVNRVVNMQITTGFDYEMYFPTAMKTYRLTDIYEEKAEQKKSIFRNTKEQCINPILSLKVNNNIVIHPHFNLFYLHK